MSFSQLKTSSLSKNIAISMRPKTVVLSWVIYSCVITIHSGVNIVAIATGLILFIALYGIVALQNDISDKETDIINQRQDIPYSIGQLTHTQASRTILVLGAVVAVAGSVINYQVLPWAILYIVLGHLYSGGSLNIKSRGVFAALLLGFCYGAMPWLIAGAATGQLSSTEILCLAFISFVFSSGVIVLKDFRDLRGDKATGKKTLLVSKGAEYTRYYYLLVTGLSYVLLAAYSHLVVDNPALLTLCLVAATANHWLLSARSIFTEPRARSIRGSWSRMIFFACVLFAYFVSGS